MHLNRELHVRRGGMPYKIEMKKRWKPDSMSCIDPEEIQSR